MAPPRAQIGVFTVVYKSLKSATALGTPLSSQRPSGWALKRFDAPSSRA
jgi:hypothetical protein